MAAATSRQTLLMLLTPTGWRLRAGWSGSETCTAARSCCWCGCDSSSSCWVSGVGCGRVGIAAAAGSAHKGQAQPCRLQGSKGMAQQQGAEKQALLP